VLEIEVFVMIDENGGYDVSKDASDLQAEAGLASRMVRVTLKVPKPKPVELEAEIAAESEAATIAVK
jgi:hypothetical protein